MNRDSLDYLKHAARYKSIESQDFGSSVNINLITNFTDEILRNILIGVCLEHKVYPVVYTVPYKQYHFALKDQTSELFSRKPDITFIFFQINPYKSSEFRKSREHFEGVIADVRKYAQAAKGIVIIMSFTLPYRSAYGNLFRENPVYKLVEEYNMALGNLTMELPNVHLFDTARLISFFGESQSLDLRGLYAFDIPFTQEFMALLAEDWFGYIRALLGKSKKCIVLDLDNTLWGGVVGELGPLGIALGTEYPGNAFVEFQRTLLDFYNRGILLAVNSKNNPEDALEVFEKNSHMVLKEKHFAAMRTNWSDKASNLIEIANELNIGTDALIFIDDDPLNRELVKVQLPEVAVPDFSILPEEYSHALLSLPLFHQFTLTEEDRQKGKMYTEERERKKVFEATNDIDQYIAELGITIRIGINERDLIPRLSQLTQKTNQFNVTTRRYAEHNIKNFIENGALIFSANIFDKFGDYGTVIVAIVIPNGNEVTLDTFLMSCRVMGRKIEYAFLDYIVKNLADRGITRLRGTFIPTPKNKPAEPFFKEFGFSEVVSIGPTREFSLDLRSRKEWPKLHQIIIAHT